MLMSDINDFLLRIQLDKILTLKFVIFLLNFGCHFSNWIESGNSSHRFYNYAADTKLKYINIAFCGFTINYTALPSIKNQTIFLTASKIIKRTTFSTRKDGKFQKYEFTKLSVNRHYKESAENVRRL